jgi:predicted DNA binding CopG/RHH family protein
MKNIKTGIPHFENEDQEREFWATHSPLDYFDSTKPQKGSFSNLKPSLKSISIRIPEDLLNELKSMANKQDVPYQSLIKIFLTRQIALERELLKGDRTLRKKRKVVRQD